MRWDNKKACDERFDAAVAAHSRWREEIRKWHRVWSIWPRKIDTCQWVLWEVFWRRHAKSYECGYFDENWFRALDGQVPKDEESLSDRPIEYLWKNDFLTLVSVILFTCLGFLFVLAGIHGI